ncbi:MAG: 4Fe-4S dicluster domain-containing protein [bacterium]
MATQGRRDFIKTLTAIGATGTGISSLSSLKATAEPKNNLSQDRMGVLVDTTICVGCRKCEWACKRAHQLESGSIESYDDKSVFKTMRRPDHAALTVVNKYRNKAEGAAIAVKVQCMHCDYPACVSACIVGALSKQGNGAVVWDESRCIGCRYCMVACPFQIPAFDFHKAVEPEIRKCDFCIERTQQGKLPACVDICPVEALTYGPRSELIKVAKERIENHPGRYLKKILGETEVGGTSWLYLSSVDFKQLDFPELGNDPAPALSESIQHGIFSYFLAPVSAFALLGGIMWMTRNKEEGEN